MQSSVKKTGEHILRLSCECGIIHELEANEKGEISIQSFYPRKEKEDAGKIDPINTDKDKGTSKKKSFSFFD
jgi:hypothetical protein